jgi:hypothetical protein
MLRGLVGLGLLAACRNSAPDAHPIDPWPATDRGSGSDASDCVTDFDARFLWGPVLAEIDVAGKPSQPPTLVEDRCWKRVYTYGGNRLVAYRDLAGKIEIDSRPERRESRACLVATMKRATELVPYAHVILDKARANLGTRWDDLDLGLGKWVDCDDPATVEVLLHEANHSLRQQQCLHDPTGPPLCFDGLAALPLRSVARLAMLPIAGGTPRDAFEDWQRVYLDASGAQSPLLLFDELLAYGITTDVSAALVATRSSERRQLMLPLVALISVHYWEVLRRDHPDQFRTAFAANRAAFARLLARTETTYAGWLAVRPSSDREVSAAEDALWQRYVIAKATLYTI